MKKVVTVLGVMLGLAVGVCRRRGAQDYRGRVQGSVVDDSRARCPARPSRCATTPPASRSPTSPTSDGRYIFDFVEPGIYTIIAELPGLQAGRAAQRRACQQRGDLTVDLTLAVGGIEERVVVEAPPVVGAVQHQQLGHHARAAS